MVVVSKEEFERLSSQEMGVVDFFLKAPLPEVDIDVERNQDLGRDMGLFNPLH